MSLMAMNRAFKKYGTVFGILMGVLMLFGVVLNGFGNNLSRPGGAVAPSGPDSANETPAVTVGEQNLTLAQLDRDVDQAVQQQNQQMRMMGQPARTPSPAEKARLRYTVLGRYKQQAALALIAQKAGVTASGDDLARERQKVWVQVRPRVAAQLGLADKATDSEIEKAMGQQVPGLTIARFQEQNFPDEAVRLSVLNDALQAYYRKQANVNEAQVRRSYDEIQVRHILVKSGDGGLPDVEAKAKAGKILAEVKANPAKMPLLATQFTDDPGSKAKGGMYDFAPAAQYVPEFTQGALDAGVGKVNPNLIKTQFGYHIIKLEAERPGKDFPKDFDKNKQKYIDEYAAKAVGGKVQAAITAEVPNVKVTITDPTLKAAQLLDEGDKALNPMAPKDTKARDAKYEQALAELAKIKPESDPQGIVPQIKAQIYTALKRPKEAVAAYEEALKFGNTVENRLALAQAYVANKDMAKAKEQLAETDKLAVPDPMMLLQIAFLWEQTGDKAKAAEARTKMQEMMKRQAALQATPPPAIVPQPAPPAPGKASPTTPAASPAAPAGAKP